MLVSLFEYTVNPPYFRKKINQTLADWISATRSHDPLVVCSFRSSGIPRSFFITAAVVFPETSIHMTARMESRSYMLIGAHAVAVSATLVTDDGAFNHYKEWIITENWAAK